MTADIVLEDEGWLGLVPDLEALVAEAASAAVAAPLKAHSVTLLFADDATLRQLNHDFRGKDRPTNVLSFPGGPVPPGEVPHLGDLALARETVAHEASAQGKTVRAHTLHLVIHGLLHLQGFDHETEAEAEAMEAREIALMAQLGYGNPYAP